MNADEYNMKAFIDIVSINPRLQSRASFSPPIFVSPARRISSQVFFSLFFFSSLFFRFFARNFSRSQHRKAPPPIVPVAE